MKKANRLALVMPALAGRRFGKLSYQRCTVAAQPSASVIVEICREEDHCRGTADENEEPGSSGPSRQVRYDGELDMISRRIARIENDDDGQDDGGDGRHNESVPPPLCPSVCTLESYLEVLLERTSPVAARDSAGL